MSRKRNCRDNAVAESLFDNLKNELIYSRSFTNRDKAKAAIIDYIDVFYNRQRLHQSLHHTSPEEYASMADVAQINCP
ncbi:MAG: IS3 family transposase [Gammaproteobacteria bacterium]|nr:IS3 family transposase [Gammaproteobacteria bacterium]